MDDDVMVELRIRLRDNGAVLIDRVLSAKCNNSVADLLIHGMLTVAAAMHARPQGKVAEGDTTP